MTNQLDHMVKFIHRWTIDEQLTKVEKDPYKNNDWSGIWKEGGSIINASEGACHANSTKLIPFTKITSEKYCAFMF